MTSYSSTPLARKPGIKTGLTLAVVNPPRAYRQLVAPLPDAAVWVSWSKKSSKMPTDITEDTIGELALPLVV